MKSRFALGITVPDRLVRRREPSSSLNHPSQDSSKGTDMPCVLSSCFFSELSSQSLSCLSPALYSQASDAPCVGVSKTQRRQRKTTTLFSLLPSLGASLGLSP